MYTVPPTELPQKESKNLLRTVSKHTKTYPKLPKPIEQINHDFQQQNTTLPLKILHQLRKR